METSDHGIAVSYDGPLESLGALHEAIEVAMLAQRLSRIPISSGLLHAILYSIPVSMVVRNHLDET